MDKSTKCGIFQEWWRYLFAIRHVKSLALLSCLIIAGEPAAALQNLWKPAANLTMPTQHLTQVWTHQIGSPQNESATGIGVDKSNGVVFVAGSTTGSLYGEHQGSNDGWYSIMSIADGAVITGTHFGNASNDVVADLAVDPFGNSYLTGSSELTQFWVRHIAPDGEILGPPLLDPSDPTHVRAIAVVDDFHFVVGGKTSTSMDSEPVNERFGWVRKYDNEYNLKWTNQFKVVGDDLDAEVFALEIRDVAVNQSGDIFAVGETTFGNVESGYQTQAYLRQISASGEPSGEAFINHTVTGPSNAQIVPQVAAVATVRDEVYVVGQTVIDTPDPNDRTKTIWLTKYGEPVDIQNYDWIITLDSNIVEDVTALAVNEANGDSYVATIADGLPTVTAFDGEGAFLFRESVGPREMRISSMVIDPTRSIYMAGTVSSDLDGDGPGEYFGGGDAYVMKFDLPRPLALDTPFIQPLTPIVRHNGVDKEVEEAFTISANDEIVLVQVEDKAPPSAYIGCTDAEFKELLRLVILIANDEHYDTRLAALLGLNRLDAECRNLLEGSLAFAGASIDNQDQERPVSYTIREGSLFTQLLDPRFLIKIDAQNALLEPDANGAFIASYDGETDVTSVSIFTGNMSITPTNPELESFTLRVGQRVTMTKEAIGPILQLAKLFLPIVQR